MLTDASRYTLKTLLKLKKKKKRWRNGAGNKGKTGGTGGVSICSGCGDSTLFPSKTVPWAPTRPASPHCCLLGSCCRWATVRVTTTAAVATTLAAHPARGRRALAMALAMGCKHNGHGRHDGQPHHHPGANQQDIQGDI